MEIASPCSCKRRTGWELKKNSPADLWVGTELFPPPGQPARSVWFSLASQRDWYALQIKTEQPAELRLGDIFASFLGRDAWLLLFESTKRESMTPDSR